MSRRHALPLCCHLNAIERDFLDQMKQQTGIVSDANLVRLGLWHLAKHLDVRHGSEVFKFRAETRAKALRGA
jgi:hypothetical protein